MPLIQNPFTRCVQFGKIVLCSLAIFYVLLDTVSAQQKGQPKAERTFVDATGKFKIRAIVVDLNEKEVKLRKADGTDITVEIAKLSERDQTFLKSAYEKYKEVAGDFPIGTKVDIFSTGAWHSGEILAVQPGKYFIKFDKWPETWNKWVTTKELRLRDTKEETPDANKASSSAAPLAASTPAPMLPAVDARFGAMHPTAVAQAMKTLPDLNKTAASAKLVDLRAAPVAGVDFKPDPVLNYSKSAQLPAPITVTAESIGNPMQVRFDSSMQYVAIDPVNFASSNHTVTIVPLDASRQRWTMVTGANFEGLTDNAQWAMIRSDITASAHLRVPLVEGQTNITPVPGDIWLPLSDHTRQSQLLPGDRMFVETIRGMLIWDIKARKVKAIFSNGSGGKCSGQGKYVACNVDQDSVAVFDTESFEVTHRFRMDGWKPVGLSFDPSGTKLAITGVGRGQVHDLATGEVLHSYSLTSSHSGEIGINWIGQKYLVLVGAAIIDLDIGESVWNLPFDRQPIVQFDETTLGLLTGSGTQATLEWVRFTPQQLANTPSIDMSKAVAIPRGAVATLDVSGLKHHTEEVKKYMESSLTSLGYQLGPNGMLQIRFSSTIGAPVNIKLKDFLRVGKTEDATYTPSTVTRKITLNGKPIYDLTTEYGEQQLKSTVRLRANESAQEAVQRLTTPSASLFTTIALPRAGGNYFPRTGAPVGQGTIKEFVSKLSMPKSR